MGELREKAIVKLAAVTGIDMDAVASTVLYNVPIGKSCVITHVVLKNASLALDTADFGIGYDGAETDVIGHAVLGGSLTATSKFRKVEPANGAEVGQPDADVLSLGVDIAQGAAATMDVDVFGYLY